MTALSSNGPTRSIALYLPHLRTGGAETVFVRLATGLERLGYRVRFVLDRGEGNLLAQVVQPVDDLGASRTLAAVPKLAAWLRRHRPDVLISALGHNNVAALMAVRLAGVATKVIVGEHSILGRQNRKDWKFYVMPALAWLFYPQAAAVVAVSSAGQSDLQAILGRRAVVEMIHNPAVADDVAARAAAAVAHPWLADDATVPVILGVGRLDPVKDFPLLIESFAEVVRQRPARLVILGEGAERETLERLRDRLGLAEHVDLPGVVADPMPWFARAKMVALSSRYEGFGLVLVEAMACGTPVATTEAGGPPAEIVKQGELGPVAPSGDRQALAAAILKVLDHPVDAALLKARAADFSFSASFAAYAALIERICDAPGATVHVPTLPFIRT